MCDPGNTNNNMCHNIINPLCDLLGERKYCCPYPNGGKISFLKKSSANSEVAILILTNPRVQKILKVQTDSTKDPILRDVIILNKIQEQKIAGKNSQVDYSIFMDIDGCCQVMVDDTTSSTIVIAPINNCHRCPCIMSTAIANPTPLKVLLDDSSSQAADVMSKLNIFYEALTQTGLPGFCHNDLHDCNVLYDGSKLNLIDYGRAYICNLNAIDLQYAEIMFEGSNTKLTTLTTAETEEKFHKMFGMDNCYCKDQDKNPENNIWADLAGLSMYILKKYPKNLDAYKDTEFASILTCLQKETDDVVLGLKQPNQTQHPNPSSSSSSSFNSGPNNGFPNSSSYGSHNSSSYGSRNSSDSQSSSSSSRSSASSSTNNLQYQTTNWSWDEADVNLKIIINNWKICDFFTKSLFWMYAYIHCSKNIRMVRPDKFYDCIAFPSKPVKLFGPVPGISYMNTATGLIWADQYKIVIDECDIINFIAGTDTKTDKYASLSNQHGAYEEKKKDNRVPKASRPKAPGPDAKSWENVYELKHQKQLEIFIDTTKSLDGNDIPQAIRAKIDAWVNYNNILNSVAIPIKPPVGGNATNSRRMTTEIVFMRSDVKKKYRVYTETSSKERYIRMHNTKVFLRTIRGKYRLGSRQ
jgi:hypothetical protein